MLDAFGAWGFAGAIVAGGALATAAAGRATFAIAGLGTLGLLLAAAPRVRRPDDPTTTTTTPEGDPDMAWKW